MYQEHRAIVLKETDNTLEKITDEYGISAAYTCMQMGAYCLFQIQKLYEYEEMEVPEGLKKFLEETYPQILSDHAEHIANENLMSSDPSGSA